MIFHFGYRGASHANEIYLRRSILILNALMGSIEAKGGFFFKKGPGEVGGKPARKLTEQKFPKIEVPRFDKVGTPDFPLPDPDHGVPQMLPHAILNEDPYPIKALIDFRFDPLMSIPDTNLTRKALDKLDLIVTIDINYSDIAWYSDVILPESDLPGAHRLRPAGQRAQSPRCSSAGRPCAPRYDTRDGAMILKQIGERIGIGEYLSLREHGGTGPLAAGGHRLHAGGFRQPRASWPTPTSQIFWDRKDGLKFKTPSGKIELRILPAGKRRFPSFPPYEPVPSPAGDQFRLVTGRMRPAHPRFHPEQPLSERTRAGKRALDQRQARGGPGDQGRGHGDDRLQAAGPAGSRPSSPT